MSTTSYAPVPVEVIGSLSMEEYLHLASPSRLGIAPFVIELALIVLVPYVLAFAVAAILNARRYPRQHPRRWDNDGAGAYVMTIVVAVAMAMAPCALMLLSQVDSQALTGRSLAQVEQAYDLQPGTLDRVNSDSRQASGDLITFESRLVVDDVVLEPGTWGLDVERADEPGENGSTGFRPIEKVRVVVIDGNRMVDLREYRGR